MHNPAAHWMKLAHDSYWLWAESCAVIAMRTTDMMTGQGSNDENILMVSEKMQAAAEVGMMLATGGHSGAHRAVRHYRRKVTANRKRLARPRG